MNSGYTEASLEDKKHDVAGKMKYPMTGKSTGRGRGMKYPLIGVNSGKGGSMNYPQDGKNTGYAKGQKSKLANSKANFSTNYTQNSN